MKSHGGAVRSVVILAAVDWEDLRQRPHHLATAWSQAGLHVLFVENLGSRRPKLSDTARILKRLARRAKVRSRGLLLTNLAVWSPVVLALVAPLSTSLSLMLARAYLARYFRRTGLRPLDCTLVLYVPSAFARELARAFAWRSVVYDVVANVTADKPHLKCTERSLLQHVTCVTSASHSLVELYGQRTTSHVFFIPDGVDPRSVPDRPAGVQSRIRLLYLGGVNYRLDFSVLAALAKASPDWDLVLFGGNLFGRTGRAVKGNVVTLPRATRYEDVWPTILSSSVGLIPYRRDEYTDGMHPAKLQEYLVAGLPVVASDTSEMQWMARTFGPGILYTASGPAEFTKAVQRALAEDSPALRQERRRLALSRTWDTVAREFAGLVGDAVSTGEMC